MRKLLIALAVVGLAVLFSPSQAQAATCWWNGYTWVCKTPPYGKYWRSHHHWRHAYRPWRHHRPHWRAWRHGYRPYAWYR